MGALLLRLRTWWETADRTQRIVTLFGSAFLAILLGGTFFFASKPKMTLLYGGLAPAEAGSVVTEIQRMGIPVESDVQGNVFVPSNLLADARARLAASGKAPSSGHAGTEDLAKLGMMSTPTVERERIKSILEGELSRSVEEISGVSHARIHITLGEATPFAAEKRPSSASVFIQEGANAMLGSEQARSIAMLVSRGVPNLELSNVYVVDSTGRTLFDGSALNGTGSQANEKLTAETAEASRRERDLQGTFDATFGAGNTVVKVNLAMDFDKKSVEKSTKTPTKAPLVSEVAAETLAGGADGAAGGAAGADPNSGNPNSANSAKTDGKEYGSTQEYKEYGSSQVNEHTEKAVGEITRMSVAVMVNEGKADPEAVRGFLTNYLAAYPGAKGEVTEVKFDTTAADAAKKAEATAGSSAKMQQIFSLLPILALAAVAFVVIKALAKTAKSTNVLVQAMPNGAMVSHGSAMALTSGAGSGSGFASTTELAEMLDDAGDVDELVNLKERFNLPLEQLKKMATERPEAVAMLLKSWMLEERR